MKMKATLLPAAAVSLLVVGCQSSQTPASDISSAEPVASPDVLFPDSQTATLWVKGLACPYCVHNIDRQLTAIPGVTRVHVDLPTGEIRVALIDPNPAIEQQLVKAIDDSGFTLDRIEMPK